MILDAAGGLMGTVGGGCGEAEVYDLAQDMLADHTLSQGALLHVDLTENPDDGGGKVCGGRFDVLLHRLIPEQHLSLVREAVEKLSQGQGFEWRTELGEARPGFWKLDQSRLSFEPQLGLGPLTGEDFELASVGESLTFVEPVGLLRRLVIVGAGHIARPLCEMAALAGYEVQVLDDRADYAKAQYFPSASQVVAGEYADALPGLIGPGPTSVVLVTRGHRHDQECLRLIVDHSWEYLGMIGSQRRVDAVFQDLVSEGVSKERLAQVCAPIGLEIGAQTPGEIAVCILAQMIQRRRMPQRLERKTLTRGRHIRALS